MNACAGLGLLLMFAAGAAAQPRAQTISGTITTADGAPAGGVPVAAIAIDFGLLSRRSTTQTGDGGAYVLEGLAPGRYLVTAGPPDEPTYYPGVSTPSSARAVIVGPAEDIGQVDFGLVAQPRFTVAGWFRPWDGRGGPPAPRVVLGGPVGTPRTADVAADGTFAFTGVTAGTYNIRIDPDPLSLPPVVVTVVQGDVTGVELRVPPASEITGRVIVEGDGPLPQLSLSFSGPFGGRRASLSPDGRFTLALPPGEHRMVLTGYPSSYVVKAASAGSTDLLTTPLTIDDQTVDEVRIVMTRAPGLAWRRVRGRLIDRGSPGSTPTVVELTSPVLLAPVQTRPDRDGRFEFAAVPPGSYQIQAGPGEIYAPAPVTVAGADIADLVVTRPRLVQVTGRIVVERNGPMPRPSLAFVREHGTIRAGVEKGGRFFARVPEGPHRVIVTELPEGYAVTSIAAGTADLLEESIVVGDVPPPEIVVSVGVDPGATWASVAGRVTGLESNATETFTLVLEGAINLLPQDALVAPDGAFRFARVLRGRYTMRLTSDREPRPAIQPRTIDVASGDVTGIEVHALPLVPVTAHVDVEGGLPVPTLALRFTGPDGVVRSAHNIDTADRRVNTMLPPGDYQVAPSGLSRGYTLVSLQDGARDLFSGRLRVVAGRPVEIRAGARSSLTHVTVSGRIVIREPGDAMPATISMFSTAPSDTGGRRGVLDFSTRVMAPVEQDGSFRFPRVAPGRYQASAVLRGIGTSLSSVTVGAEDLRDVEILVPRFVELTGRLTVEGQSGCNGAACTSHS